MLGYEDKLYAQGYKTIACIDEVGRGCLAGSVIACAIIMPRQPIIPGIRDSKKLSPKRREELYDLILGQAIGLGIGEVDPGTVDEINIKEATRLAMKRAVKNIKDKNNRVINPDFLLIDAEKVDIDLAQEAIIKGDEKSYGIQCAAIVAKVYRDRLCVDWDKDYPGYKIYKNKGYGTLEHRQALKSLGPSPIHRRTFLRNIL